MAGDFDPYYTWLGIPPEEQPPHHYRLLGIRALEGNADVIQNAADRIMAQLRTYQAGHHSAESQKLLNEVAAARVCLLNPDKKAAYDAALRQRLAPQSAVQVSPAADSVDASLIGLSGAMPHLVPHSVAQHRPTAAVPIHQRPWFLPAAIAAGIWCVVVVVLAWALLRRGPAPPVQVADETPSQEAVLKPYNPPTVPAAPASPKKETATPTPPPTPPAPDKTQETIAKPSPETLPAPVASTATLPTSVSPRAPSTIPSSAFRASPSPPAGLEVPSSRSSLFVGHIVAPFHIDFTLDGKRMMSSPMGFKAVRINEDQTREYFLDSIRIWDVESHRCLAKIAIEEEGRAFVRTARLSADGRYVIWVQPSFLRVWDWEASREVRIVRFEEATGAAMLPDRRHVVITHREGDPLRVWDIETGQVARRIPYVGQNRPYLLALSADGRWLLFRSSTSQLNLLDLETGSERRIPTDNRKPIAMADFSSDGQWAFSCAAYVSPENPGDKELRVWDLRRGQIVRHLVGHKNPVQFVRVSPRGTRAVSICRANEAILWSLDNGRELARVDSVKSAAFTADGTRLVLSTWVNSGQMRFWDLGDLAGPQGAPNVAAWSDDTIPSSSGVTASTGSTPATPSATLSSGGASGAPGIPPLSAAPGAKEVRQIDPGYNRTATRCLALSADGKRLVTGPRSQSELAPRGGQPVWSTDPLYVWDVETGKRLATFEGHQADDLLGVFLLNEGRQVLSVGGHSARIWDAATGRPLRQLVGERFTWWHTLSSDGRRFYASDLSNIIAWDTLSGRQLGRMPPLQQLSGLALNGDGRLMLTAFQDGGARLWDLDRSTLIRSLQDTATPFNRAVLSPDGSTFLAWSNIYRSGANAAELRLYSAKTGEMIRPFSGLRYPPGIVWFLPNGVRAISVSSSIDGVILWDVETGKPLWRLPRHGAFALSADGRHIAVGAGYAPGVSLVSVWDLGDDAGPPPKAIKPRSRKPGR